MNLLPESYPFSFIQRKYDLDDPDLKFIELYHFKSEKSKLWYIVRVECYDKDAYAVKFYLKNHRLSPNKYQMLTNTYEPRRIIYSVMNVMLHIFSQNRQASFAFIGANSEGESESETKRYRVYCRIVANLLGNKEFEHYENKSKSAYALISRRQLNQYPHLVEEFEDFFTRRYDYFD